LANVTVASATATQFTVTTGITTQAVYNQNGVAYVSQLNDVMGTGNVGSYIGQVAFPTYGTMVYDPQNCTDIANGGNSPSGYFVANNSATSSYGVDCWVLGQGLYSVTGTVASNVVSTTNGTNQIATLAVDTQGYLYLSYTDATHLQANYYVLDGSGNKIQVSDGYWHHIGFTIVGGTLYVYCDGNFTSTVSVASLPGIYYVGSLYSATQAESACYAQDVVICGSSVTQNDVKNRWIAGSLLQRGQPVTSTAIYSGDRIAEILVIAGFGSISGGTLSGLSSIYNINGTAYTTPYSSSNGYINVEPYYWDSPVYNSTALDLIQQVTDTDVGAFRQKRDGTFQFNTQAFYGNWAWTPSTASGTWTPNSYSPSGTSVWTDDTTSGAANYEAPSLQILRDDADLWTIVRVSPQSGIEQVYDSGNELRWGFSTLAKSGTVHPSLTLALSTANYLGYLYRSPLPRVQNVELRNTNQNGATLPAILGTKFGDVVLFKRSAPNSNPATTTSSTSNTIGTGTKTFTVASGLWMVAGQTMTAASGANTMTGTVTSYTGTTLTLSITSTTGSGTFSSWTITGTYPDVMGTISQNMVVESYNHSFNAEPGTYTATFVLDPYPVRS
jgi:hypothetical protein